MLVADLVGVVVLSMVLIYIMVAVVRLLVLGHVHVSIPLMVLGSVHDAVLALVSILGIHVKIMCKGRVCRRSRGRGGVGSEMSSRPVWGGLAVLGAVGSM